MLTGKNSTELLVVVALTNWLTDWLYQRRPGHGCCCCCCCWFFLISEDWRPLMTRLCIYNIAVYRWTSLYRTCARPDRTVRAGTLLHVRVIQPRDRNIKMSLPRGNLLISQHAGQRAGRRSKHWERRSVNAVKATEISQWNNRPSPAYKLLFYPVFCHDVAVCVVTRRSLVSVSQKNRGALETLRIFWLFLPYTYRNLTELTANTFISALFVLLSVQCKA